MVISQANSVPSPPGRRERKRNETREKLFRAALALFARQGFEATRVEQITEAADVAKGTFFNYFPSKQHLLMHLVGRQIEKMDNAAVQARHTNKPMNQVLRALGQELAKLPGETPELTRCLLAVFLSTEEVRDTIHAELAVRARGKLAELVKLGQERGEIRSDLKPLEIARAYQQSMLGTMLLWSLHPDEPLEKVVDRTQGVLWSGLKATENVSDGATRRKRDS